MNANTLKLTVIIIMVSIVLFAGFKIYTASVKIMEKRATQLNSVYDWNK